jgi:protein SCO1/2
MLRIVVIALVLLVAAMFLLPRERNAVPAPEIATLLEPGLELPEFTLVDDAGRPFTAEDLRGDYRLMFFGFTYCPDICPLTLQVLATVRSELLAQAPDLVPDVVFVSVDPGRDTPARIRDYLNNFDPAFVGVTGSDEQIAPLISALGVTVHKTEVDGEYYNVVHNGTVFVVGPRAEVIAIFGGSSHDAAELVTDYLRIRRRSPRTAAP